MGGHGCSFVVVAEAGVKPVEVGAGWAARGVGMSCRERAGGGVRRCFSLSQVRLRGAPVEGSGEGKTG